MRLMFVSNHTNTKATFFHRRSKEQSCRVQVLQRAFTPSKWDQSLCPGFLSSRHTFNLKNTLPMDLSRLTTSLRMASPG